MTSNSFETFKNTIKTQSDTQLEQSSERNDFRNGTQTERKGNGNGFSKLVGEQFGNGNEM